MLKKLNQENVINNIYNQTKKRMIPAEPAEPAEAKKVVEAKKKDVVQPTKEELKASENSKRLRAEGFHNCTKLKLEVKSGQIVGIAKKGQKIKAMHESNIDVFNEQQVNTHLFLKKDGVSVELVDVNITGRKKPLKMYMDKK